MKASIISALFAAGAIAMPAALQKRATFTSEVVVTLWTTTTVYTNPTDAAAAFAERSSSSSKSSTLSSSSAPAPSSTKPTTTAAAAVVTPPPAVTTTPAPVAAVVTTTPAAVVAPAVVAPAAAAPATGGLLSGTGDLTYYDLSVGLTSCGGQYSNDQAVVALSYIDIKNGANSNTNALCGKTISITWQGKTLSAQVVDTCMGCASGAVDLSPSLFTSFTGGLTAGRVSGATWVVN